MRASASEWVALAGWEAALKAELMRERTRRVRRGACMPAVSFIPFFE
jgi:hypothetical protein